MAQLVKIGVQFPLLFSKMTSRLAFGVDQTRSHLRGKTWRGGGGEGSVGWRRRRRRGRRWGGSGPSTASQGGRSLKLWGFRIVKDWQFEVSGCGLDMKGFFLLFGRVLNLKMGEGSAQPSLFRVWIITWDTLIILTHSSLGRIRFDRPFEHFSWRRIKFDEECKN